MFAGTALIVLLVAAPPSPDAIARAQEDVLSDGAYQKSWPTEQPPRRDRDWRDGDDDPTRWEPFEARDTPEGGPGSDDPFFRRRRNAPVSSGGGGGGGKAILQALVWIAAGAVLVMLLMALVRAWTRTPQDIQPKPEAPPPAQAPPVALARPLTEAERLAAEGRFAEAVHVLLLETITALSVRTEGGLARSLTSREVLESGFMPDAARDAMGNLVRSVERSLFGNRPVDQVEYEQCSAAFTTFRTAYEGAQA